MWIKRVIIPLIILIINYQQGISQNLFSKKQLYVEGFYHYGFVAPHHDYMAYFINEHVQGFQVNLGISTIGNKFWNKYYNYPRIGIGYYHSGLGNRNIYGLLNAGYLYVDRSFFNLSNRFNLGNRISLGLGHISKIFDLYSNSYNTIIGTKLNVFIQYNIEGAVKITPLVQMKMGLSLIHSSNGSIHEPNIGFNIVTSSIGLQYSLTNQVYNIKKESPINPDSSKNQFITSAAFGWKSISRFHSYEYPVYDVSCEYSRKISSTGWLGLALTGYCDRSIKKEFEIQLVPDSTFKPSDYYSIALNPSYEMKMGRLSFLFQPGIYLKHSVKEYGLITNRIGLRYNFRNNMVAGISIKAHWLAKADVVEWNIGYRWKK
ncbi:MAG: acyloxyacyl hydrolase [Bacteroidales bacterium]|nr:acyloxyacyl hydrolase [Bacteroidales bacterium]